MAFEDHVAILIQGAFDRPAKNKFKPNDPPEYFAVVAVDPSAGPDLQALLAAVNPNWQNMGHPIKPNGKLDKPYPGIPDNWLTFRMQSQYVPEIRDTNGTELFASAENAGYIRSQLYAGTNVRVRGTVKEWEFSGKRGLKFYLGGVMAVGGGERRATSGSFDKYVPQDAPAQQSTGFGGQEAIAAARGAPDAFGGNQSAPAQNAVANDPFAQKPATGGGAFG